MEGNRTLKKVLIAEDDSAIQDILSNACLGQADVVFASDSSLALDVMATQFFDLLLLDWRLGPAPSGELIARALRLQPNAWRIVLFTIPAVDDLILAMKSGAHDAWWVARGMELRDGLLKEWIEKTPVSKGFPPLLLSQLAEDMSAKAASNQISFFKARQEFSKTLIRQITQRHDLSRSELAQWMGVSVRTIQRLMTAPEE